MRRSDAEDAVRTYDLNRNLWNLSLVEHPSAVVNDLMAAASERMAARVTKSKSEIPKRALVMVGAGPDAVSKMTPSSRTAQVMWRLFSQEQLAARFKAINAGRVSTSSARGLGIAPNTNEWYVPAPPEIEDELRDAMRERREEFLREVRARG
jgi:hypothetical protein